MNADFPRVLTLLRKERGISQKQAASELGVSQALLSHYEKGIRECGLDFLVRAANFYGVSCDYLLGRSPDRNGATLTVEDIPEPDAAGKENRGSILPTLNKKLIANSLNILYDILGKSGNKTMINEVSSFLMLSVYRMFRIVHSVNTANQKGMFTIPETLADSYAQAEMERSSARARACALGEEVDGIDPVESTAEFAMTTQSLSQNYPLFASSLLNLIQNSESKMKIQKRK